MKKPKKNGKLLEGDHRIVLIKMTLPMMFGLLSVILFNLVDTLYIAQLGVQELSAISYTFPIVFSVISLGIGLSGGASALISQAIGRGDQLSAARFASHSILIAACLVITIAVLGTFTINPLFSLLGANKENLDIIKDYMYIWYPSTALIIIPIVGNGAIRATGDSVTPSFIMSISGLSNIILDPLFIFGWGPFPRLEVEGAAIATALSYSITFFASIWILWKREKLLQFKLFWTIRS